MFSQPNASSASDLLPDIGQDLIWVFDQGFFSGYNAERLMAVIELMRHGEITVQAAAQLVLIPYDKFVNLLIKLPLADMQRFTLPVETHC